MCVCVSIRFKCSVVNNKLAFSCVFATVWNCKLQTHTHTQSSVSKNRRNNNNNVKIRLWMITFTSINRENWRLDWLGCLALFDYNVIVCAHWRIIHQNWCIQQISFVAHWHFNEQSQPTKPYTKDETSRSGKYDYGTVLLCGQPIYMVMSVPIKLIDKKSRK